MTITVHGQNSPWQLRVGYEHVFTSPNLSDGLSQNEYVFSEGEDDYVAFRAFGVFSSVLGIRYDIAPWFSICYDLKTHYRRYYVNGPDYNEEKKNFDIAEYVGLFPETFLGRTLSMRSSNFGLSFQHPLGKKKRWLLHYYLSLNFDQYERQLHYHERPVNYGSSGLWYTNRNGQKVNVEETDRFEINTDNSEGMYELSTNMALGLSRKMRNGQALKFEFGLRNISWTENFLLPKNHWELDFQHIEYIEKENGEREVLKTVREEHDFPLYIGGLYTSLSYTFRPFRSKRDDPDYKKVPLGKKIKSWFKKDE